jgi:glycosyltransferase involved in cell wall biosynthesis
MKIVLNAIISRRNGGGATQIVLNYLNATLNDREVEWYYIVSEEIVDLLKGKGEISSSQWLVLPRQPQVKSYYKAKKAIRLFLDEIKPDIVYSILAPSYFSFKYTEVMRCCNAWDVIDKSDEAFSFIDRKTRLRFGAKTFLVRRMMRKADYFITQTQVAKEGIVRVTGKCEDRVSVIPNVLPRFYQSIIPESKNSERIDILYVASPAPHKNIEIIPGVAHILKFEYGLKGFRFLITIPPEDSGVASQITKKAQELSVEEEVVNIGGKSQKELVDLYESATIGFFPSVLETFSATLLEYMYFSLPVVSSNKPFNTEVLGEAALFFNSNDAKGAAESIFSIVTNQVLRDSLKKIAKQRITKYLDYSAHYRSTIEFFKYIVEQEHKNKS